MSGFSQSTSEPYTYGSYGLINSDAFIYQQLMGGLGSTTRNKGSFSLVNPASLSAVKYSILKTGVNLNYVQQQQNNSQASHTKGNLEYFSLGMPLKKNMGFSVALNQFSNIDYLFNIYSSVDTNTTLDSFNGYGGINQLKLGYGIEVFKGFSVGVGATFLFGNLQDITVRRFTNNSAIFSTVQHSISYFNGAKWNGGVQYNRQIWGEKNLAIGLQGGMESNLKRSTDKLVYTANSVVGYPIDTVLNQKDLATTSKLPSWYGFALSLENENAWMIGAEYNSQLWSKVQDIKGLNSFYDQTQLSIGGYYQIKKQPQSDKLSARDRRVDYIKNIRYYAGYRSANLYTGIAGTPISERSVSLGVGLPFYTVYKINGIEYRMVSRVNVGVEYIMRGQNDNNLIEENILGIKFGLTLNDKWFNKRKYN
ncbi:MAG: hypothetical protein H6607_01950 [Flavobacteriales bacterium]|nr:hypothetical protein [Flavobacteriales bacterium]